MKKVADIMGMPVSIEITDTQATSAHFEEVFDYLRGVDATFSTYKEESEMSRINRGEILPQQYSPEMKEVFNLADKAKAQTNGFFNIQKEDGKVDPSGLVKGWAIQNAEELLHALGFSNFYIDIGGDVATSGKETEDKEWSIGIRNPFKLNEIVKVLYPKGAAVATSGTYIRGEHIYNPHTGKPADTDVISLTVVGPRVYEADLYATAAFAMGEGGLLFIENKPQYEGYSIDRNGIATMTSGFEEYTSV